MAREYICLVGSPSNTFNGYMYEVPGGFKPCPAPTMTDPDELEDYILGPLDPKTKKRPKRVSTHDLYWGNFILAALRLYMLRKDVAPHPGDTITFLVYLPPYVARELVDWEASPHNPVHERVKGVTGPARKLEEFKTFEEAIRARGWPPLPCPAYLVNVLEDLREQYRKLRYSSRRRDIDYDILMRTTTPNSGPYRLYDMQPEDQFNSYLHQLYFNVPEFIVWGMKGERKGTVPIHKNIMARVLFFSRWEEAKRYLLTGRWQGRLQRLAGRVNCYYGEDAKKKVLDLCDVFNLEALCDGYGLKTVYYPKTNWVYCSAPPSYPKLPGINRRVVKIARFDYFGHASPLGLFLEYGWTNEKGELPNVSCLVRSDEFTKIWKMAYRSSLLDKGASAQLWGCHMLELGQKLAPYFEKVEASNDVVNYEGLLAAEGNMPTTSEWLTPF